MIGGEGGSRPAISARFASASASQSPSLSVSPQRASEVSAKAERVTAKAGAHFEKHRQLWTNRQYGELLARDGERMSFRPNGMVDDRKAHLMRAADHIVMRKQAARLSSIEQAAAGMIGNGKRRDNDRGR